MTADLEALADKVDEAVQRITRPATFELVRACLNEAGVNRARVALVDALTGLAAAQAAKRDADTVERDRRKQLDDAKVLAKWGLKPPDVNEAGAKLLADDKKEWVEQQLLADPAVVAAADGLRAAEHDTAVARDALTIADHRLKACRADLDAAVATLGALSLALPARKGAE